VPDRALANHLISMWTTRFYLDKVFITLTSYPIGNELHGCYRQGMLQMTHDIPPCYIAKGTLAMETKRADAPVRPLIACHVR
jgi:hypothetical protein